MVSLTRAFDTSQAKALVAQILVVYEATLFLNAGAEGGQREVQVGDELVLIACHLLRSIARWPASSERPKEQGLFEIACILECALEKSGYNFHMKLLLMQVYTILYSYSCRYCGRCRVFAFRSDMLSCCRLTPH
jgi:N-terminal acetyltransferase B complex non-catalytic subunit